MKNKLKKVSVLELVDELVSRKINLLQLVEQVDPNLKIIPVYKNQIKSMSSLESFSNKSFKKAYKDIEWLDVDVAAYEYVTNYIKELIEEELQFAYVAA